MPQKPVAILEPGLDESNDTGELPAPIPDTKAEQTVAKLPKVTILTDRTPADLLPDYFLAAVVTRVLTTTPVNMHVEARRRRTATLTAAS